MSQWSLLVSQNRSKTETAGYRDMSHLSSAAIRSVFGTVRLGLFTVYLLSLPVLLSAATACTASSARRDHRPAKTVRFGCFRSDVVVFTAI